MDEAVFIFIIIIAILLPILFIVKFDVSENK